MAAIDISALVSALDDLLAALNSGHARKNALNTQALGGKSLQTILTDAKTLVTKGDVGLALVENLSLATQQLAEAATAPDLYMTPLSTKQLLDAMRLASQLAANQSKLTDLKSRMTKLEAGASGTAARNDVGTESMLRFLDKKKQVIVAGALAPYAPTTSPVQTPNSIYFIPVIYPRAVTVVQIGLIVDKASQNDAFQEVGIYASNGSNTADLPGTELFNGRINPTAQGLMLMTLPTPLTLVADTVYWIGFAGLGSEPLVKHFDGNFAQTLLGGSIGANTSNFVFIKVADQDFTKNPAITATARSKAVVGADSVNNLTLPIILLHETLYTA